MDRLPTNYNNLEGLDSINSEDLLQIELNAKILTLEDCFDLLMLNKEELSKKDLDICQRVHKRGMKKGITAAADSLFNQMKSRGGTDACLNYLKAFSGQFIIETVPDSSQTGFTFNVNLPDGTSEKTSIPEGS